MVNKTKIVFSLAIVSLLVATICVIYENREMPIVEKNYAGLYSLGLIPNSYELPATKADKILATSSDGKKQLVDSPFGYTYVRATN